MADEDEFLPGEMVRIKSGAFQLFTGRVVKIEKEKGTLKVIISVLGKWRIVELRLAEVEKAS